MDGLTRILTELICMLVRQQRLEQIQKKKAEQQAHGATACKKREAQTELERMHQGGPGFNKQFRDQQEKDEQSESAYDEEETFGQISQMGQEYGSLLHELKKPAAGPDRGPGQI